MEVISGYMYDVGCLGRVELKSHKNRTKNKRGVHFYETFLVLENTAEELCKGYLRYDLRYSNKKKLNYVRINQLEGIKHRSFK